MPRLQNTVLGYVARKGAKELLEKLKAGREPARFSELYIPSVFATPATLVARLKELENIGAIVRVSNPHAIGAGGVVNPGEEVKIRYKITEHGTKILAILEELERVAPG